MNNWDEIRLFYAGAIEKIMAAPKNVWAIDRYSWETSATRLAMTPIETWLWHDICAEDLVLYPQFPIFHVFADFANPRAKVAIECDGAEFHTDHEKDAARDRLLMSAGWAVYRITGKDCRNGVGMDNEGDSVPRRLLRDIADQHRIRVGA